MKLPPFWSVLLLAVAIGLIGGAAARVINDHTSKDLIIVESDKRIAALETHVAAQATQLRILAYHQAVAQLEQYYPIEYREKIPAQEWEQMLSDRTDAILKQFLQEHGNGSP